ncbi:hypothetical protein L210DRAFT_3550533 [Boletus edulis BED1]|uniref:Uncharacterized protein n=1 Tax=Boletus edulis BED1 TaxID=1328754 RepID=A0AAD4BNA4_BOLED|nr:hypothetical protein L210DRAFT_3550533 [Boletus edulis BED1]
MATVHLYQGRRWLGWYNAPGSYTIAKRFGRMANSRFWDGLFPGPNDCPVVSFGLDGKKGPQYIAALSGTTLKRGIWEVEGKEIAGRKTTPVNVAYLVMKNVDYKAPVKLIPFKSALWGLIPITVSVVTCIMCALVYDWFNFSMILIGVLTSGLASAFIGKGKLVIKSVSQPASGAPPGDGILIGEDGVVVIKGMERDVNAITKGRFDLLTDSTQATCEYRAIGVCSLLHLVQFLFQLLLVPQGTLFGQTMFLVSLGMSWGILFETLGNPEMRRFRAGTRTTMAVFACLLLFNGVERSSQENDRENRDKILKSCIPNDTDVWRRWREKVVKQLLNISPGSNSLPYLVINEGDLALPESDKMLLKQLLEDAQAAFTGYFHIRGQLVVDGSHQ